MVGRNGWSSSDREKVKETANMNVAEGTTGLNVPRQECRGGLKAATNVGEH